MSDIFRSAVHYLDWHLGKILFKPHLATIKVEIKLDL